MLNDKKGHETGDELLKVIANRIQASVRSTDTVVRLGGDEFVLIIAGISDDKILTTVINKIQAAIAKPIKIKEHEIHITSSIGISIFPADGDNLEALMKSADLAMYQVKREGRNNYKFYH